MLIDSELMDSLAAMAKNNPRKRQHYDLRTQAFEKGEWNDTSQRMLNVLMPNTVIPIHRHNETTEIVICIRGAVEEIFFSSEGVEIERYVLRYGSECSAIQVPRGVYHTCKCLEEGSVIFEAKDRAYDSIRTEDLWGKASM